MALDIPALIALKQQLGFYGAGGGQRSQGQQIGEALGNVGKGLATAGQGIGEGADIAKKIFEAQKLKNDITSLGTQIGLPSAQAEAMKNQIFQNQSASQGPVQGPPQQIPSTLDANGIPTGPQLVPPTAIPLQAPETPRADFIKKFPMLNPDLNVDQNLKIAEAMAKQKESDRTPRLATKTDELATGGAIKQNSITNEQEVKLFSTKDNAKTLAGAQNARQANQLAMTQQQINIARENLQREKGKDATQAFDTLTSAIRTKMEDPNITPDQSKFLNDQLQFASTNGYLPQTSVDGMRFLGMNLPSDFPFGKPIQKIIPKKVIPKDNDPLGIR